MEENDENNVSTAGKDKEKRDQQKQGKKGEKVKKAAENIKRGKKIAEFLSNLGILVPVIVIILVIIGIIGAVGYFTALPGLWMETAKDYALGLWGNIVGFVTGDDITPTIKEKDQIELAQHIQEMGFDIVGYGFADVRYEDDDEPNAEEIDGQTNNTIKEINRSVDGRNYLQAYIAQSEAIYRLSRWSIKGWWNNWIVKKWWDSLFNNSSEVDPDNRNVKAYSAGMLNVDSQYEDVEVKVDRKNKLLKLEYPRSFLMRDTYYFNLENWTSRYGKPLELFLSLHLATMMPDLTYDLATEPAFNTKVNIELQRVNATYKVIFDKDGTGQDPIMQEDIERAYLKIMCSMSDEQINRFANAGVLDEAFKMLLEGRTQIEDYKLDAYDGALVDDLIENPSTSLGTDLTKVEKELLGQEYSTVTIKVRRIRIDDRGFVVTDVDGNIIYEWQEKVIHKYLRCVDINDEGAVNQAQSELNNTILSGISMEQFEEFSKLIIEGIEESIAYLPRVSTVDNHWYYSYVRYVYGQASKAKKKIEYIPASDDSPLSNDNLNGGTITLDQTFTDPQGVGVYYQLCEPEVDGPNDAIIALFKGGSGSFNGVDYDFSGQYYRYDGTRRTAQIIANAKASEGQKVSYNFQNRLYPVVSLDNEDWKIEKQDVTFATEDENGNKSYTDAFSAFAILENTHSLEAEAVYRNLKDLVVKLRYFSKENFTKPLTQVLLWPVESIVNYDTIIEEGQWPEGIEKDENEYGLFLKSGEAYYNGGNILAPGDATVESIDGDTIKIKFKSISEEDANELEAKFGDDYKTIDRDIVLDMEMTITGVTPTVSVGDTISRGQYIGTATGEEIRFILYNIDKSIVDDIETYMYPLYEETEEDDFMNPGDGSSGSGSSGSNNQGTFDPDLVIPEIGDAPNRIYRALRNLGCTKAGACGALGNIKLESNFNPNAQSSISTAYGLVQWTRSSGRRASLESWCAQEGRDYTTFDGQLGFFLYELQQPYYRSVWNALTTSDDVLECAEIFARRYEGCTDALNTRKTYANSFMNQMAD